MDDLPDAVAWEILDRIKATADKSSISLTCKRLYELQKQHRKSIRVGCGLDPANEAMLSLCKRFQNLEKVEISYTGWRTELGNQLDDRGLYNLSISCPLLANLTLRSCFDITDAGLSHLASCSHLSTLKLMYARSVTGSGMLFVVDGCKKLASVHLGSCGRFTHLEWLGRAKKLEDFSIENCRGIGEDHLIKLGPSWETLKRLRYEVLNIYLNATANVKRWPLSSIPPPCDIVELVLVNTPGGGLSSVFGKFRSLNKIHLDMCLGVKDSDMIALAQNSSSNLRAVSLRVPSDLCKIHTKLTDECLKALAENCSRLESVRIAFSSGAFASFQSFSLQGILGLVLKCPVRELALDSVYSFDDAGIGALCGAEHLEQLELIRCQKITDIGIQLAADLVRLRVLKLSRCGRVSDKGLKLLRRLPPRKLEVLAVVDCPMMSERGVEGAADSVSFTCAV